MSKTHAIAPYFMSVLVAAGAIAPAFAPARAEDDSGMQWRDEVREERRKEREAAEHEASKRDPLLPLYAPGPGVSGSTGGRATPQNPLGERNDPARYPWSVQ